MAQARLAKDLQRILANPTAGVTGAPVNPSDLFLWRCCFVGPQDTPYKNGTYTVELKFPPDYPQSPPHAKFLCQMFHPNVYKDGEICVDILKKQGWSPKFDVCDVLKGLMALFYEPNPNSPANGEAAKMFTSDYPQYERECWRIAQLSWESAD